MDARDNMNVNDFIKTINEKKVEQKYIFTGSDDYLIGILIKGLIKVLNIENADFNIARFDESIWDFDRIYESIMVLPVFSDKKLTIINLTNAKKKDIVGLDNFMSNINNIPKESIIVVVLGNNIIEGLDKSKFNAIDVTLVDDKFLLNRINLVVTKANQKNIDVAAANLLIEYSNRDLGKIVTESKKLVAYVGERNEITTDDVKAVVVKTLDYEVFELTNALGKKDSLKAFTLVNSMKEKKDEFKGILGLIYNYFRRLLHISLAKNKDMKQLAQDLGVKEGAIKFAMAQEKMFGAMKLKKIVDLCMKYDYETKQTITTIDNAVDILLLTILNM